MDYPLVNGNRHDYSSVEINVNSRIFTGVSEVSYSDALEPGKIRGTSAMKNGRTRGEYDPDGSITLYKSEFQELIAALGAGYMEVSFPIVVHYQEPGSPIITDRLIGCRIKKAEDSHKEGSEALVVKCDLDIMGVVRNGVTPVRDFNLS